MQLYHLQYIKMLTSIDFNDNGFYFATSDKDGTCRIWDWSKSSGRSGSDQSVQLKVLDIEENGTPCYTVKFDDSGMYLAAGKSNGMHVFPKICHDFLM